MSNKLKFMFTEMPVYSSLLRTDQHCILPNNLYFVNGDKLKIFCVFYLYNILEQPKLQSKR